MRTITFAAVALIALSASAAADVREVSNFTSIAASDQLRVEISTAGDFAVSVTGSDADRIVTRVEDDMLRIYMRNRPWFGSPRLDATVRITAPSLDRVVAARGASVRAEGVTADVMRLTAAMGGSIRISGTCRELHASAAMGGAIDADAFECETAEVSAAMGGAADVFASQSLDAAASMGGDIDVEGSPAHTNRRATMGGDISLN